MDQNFDQKLYASGRLRALLTILLLAVAITHAVFAMIWNAAPGVMLRGTGDLGALEEIDESVTEMLYVWVVLLQVVIFTATAVAFLTWLHRVYRNLPALGAANPGTTPGWAVGYFLIPFVNLFKPFQVVCEIWRESMPPAPETHEGFVGGSAQSSTPALVGWWWGFWIIAYVSMLAGERALDKSVTIEGMLLASRLIVASHALFVVAGVLAILVVKRIDEMQEAKFRRMAAQGPPPPPESFETPGVV